MDQTLARTKKKFDTEKLSHGMFDEFNHALHFGLGGKEFGTDRTMRRFLQAHERANAISQSLFSNS